MSLWRRADGIIDGDAWDEAMTGIENQGVVYIYYKDGARYYAKNAESGIVDFDDTDFHTVINQGIAARQGVHLIERGTYTIVGDIVGDSDCVIEGEGDDTLLQVGDDLTTGVITFNTKTNFKVRNLYIDGVKGIYDGGDGINCTSCSYFEIESVTIEDTYECCIRTYACQFYDIHDNTLLTPRKTDDGTVSAIRSKTDQVTDNFMGNIHHNLIISETANMGWDHKAILVGGAGWDDPVMYRNGVYLTVNHNLCYYGQIVIEYSVDSSMTGNKTYEPNGDTNLHHCVRCGIYDHVTYYSYDVGVSIFYSSHSRIINCTARESDNSGFAIDRCQYTIMIGCHAYDNGKNPDAVNSASGLLVYGQGAAVEGDSGDCVHNIVALSTFRDTGTGDQDYGIVESSGGGGATTGSNYFCLNKTIDNIVEDIKLPIQASSLYLYNDDFDRDHPNIYMGTDHEISTGLDDDDFFKIRAVENAGNTYEELIRFVGAPTPYMLVNTDHILYFRDTGMGIYSNAANILELFAPATGAGGQILAHSRLTVQDGAATVLDVSDPNLITAYRHVQPDATANNRTLGVPTQLWQSGYFSQDVSIDGSSDAYFDADRNAAADEALLRYYTAGVMQWQVGLFTGNTYWEVYDSVNTQSMLRVNQGGDVDILNADLDLNNNEINSLANINSGELVLDGATNAGVDIDRNAAANTAHIIFETADVDQWRLGMPAAQTYYELYDAINAQTRIRANLGGDLDFLNGEVDVNSNKISSDLGNGSSVLEFVGTAAGTPAVTWGAAAGNEASAAPTHYLEVTITGAGTRYIPCWQ